MKSQEVQRRIVKPQANIVSSGSDNSDNDEHNDHAQKGRRITISRRRTSTSFPSVRSHHRSTSQKYTKHFVLHNYHDHSKDPLELQELDTSEQREKLGAGEAKKRRRKNRGGVTTPFPEKLHYMLGQMDSEETSHIVNWQPHGRCFVVHNPKEFVEKIMPRYFRQTKMTSFQRQLNLYGFCRLTTGRDRGGYYHELFIRGRTDLCKKMVRTRVKGNGSKAASSPSTEPNFYTMVPCIEQEQNNHVSTNYQQTSIRGHSTDDMSVLHQSITEIDEMLDTDIDFDPATAELNVHLPSVAANQSSMEVEDCRTRLSMQTIPVRNFESVGLPRLSTPVIEHNIVSPPGSPRLSSSSGSLNQGPARQMNFQSGDQLYFEGLPFHYLETKGIEDSLLNLEEKDNVCTRAQVLAMADTK